MHQFTLLTDLFQPLEEDHPERECLVFLDQRGQISEQYSQALFHRWVARAAQSFLEETAVQGSSVLMAIADPARFSLCFGGLMLAGAVPAPLAPFTPRQGHASFERLKRIVRDDQISVLVLDNKRAEQTRTLLAEAGLDTVVVIDFDTLLVSVPKQELDAAHLANLKPTDVAYIQYTSGSTSRPKGVALSHKNVLANLAFMEQVFEREEDVRLACWLPLHHDMGLVGNLLTVLYGRGFGVFMSPTAFLLDPSIWLSSVHNHRINSAAMPNFALELCADRVTPNPDWDLSCWKQIFVGAEPVNLAALERFSEAFSDTGLDPDALRPVYGMAEASLLVAGGREGFVESKDKILHRSFKNGVTRALLPFAVQEGIDVSIRSPETGMLMPEGDEGEIYLRGDSLADRYLEGTELSTPQGFATGDLGLLQADQLYITGREKDVVIVRGRGMPAEDIEELLSASLEDVVGGLPSVAVSHHQGEREAPYLFQEVHRALPMTELPKLRKRISATMIENYGWAPEHIVFVPAKFLPRTSSNKIMRAACLAKFFDGSLKTLNPSEADETAQPSASSLDVGQIAEPAGLLDDPIVVVGMACKFPGADTIDAFWENLCNGVDSISEVPKSRWDNDLWYDPRPGIPGKANTKWGGFVNELDLFDADHFELSPVEARETDPQHRMLLETSWRLLETLGLKRSDLAKSNTGVYVGISGADYLHAKISLTTGLTSHNAYTGLGNAHCIAANRLSYFYDLKGPSMSVDTACSSSLTAFNLAVQAVRFGECDQAMVAGVNTMFTPGSTTVLSQFGMMSPEGRCKTFDASADGYVRSEGCGMVMIKRRSEAIAAGDKILAEVKASVSAQDGAGTKEGGGITFPNGAAQDALIARALAQSGLSGQDISYVESHGTGTAAGDPIEVTQLKRHYGQKADDTAPACWMGAVKANVGHLESAAGVAGLIKTILVLQHKMIPPQIHIQHLNPQIALDETRLVIPKSLQPWELPDGVPYMAAVSSFGFGGALAHAILSEPSIQPRKVPENPDMPGFQHFPLGFSSQTHEGLRATLARVSQWLRDKPGLPLSDISHSFAKGRTPQKHRATVVAKNGLDAAQQLDDILTDERFESVPARPTRPCFLFSGQGELYAQMGKDFYERYPVFRAAFDRCAAVINPLEPNFDLAEFAFADRELHIDRDRYNLPILFANQHALTELFAETGLSPAYVLGHSMGEFAAASAAGVLSPEDAMWLLYHRARLMEDLTEPGLMMVVQAGEEVVAPLLDPKFGQIAAFNGPKRLTIAGHMNHIQTVAAQLNEQGITTRPLHTNFAFHSPMVEPVLNAYRSFLEQVSFRTPQNPWISSVTGEVMTEAPTVQHWLDQLSQPVLYDQALENLRRQSVDFIEIGPGGSCLALALSALGKRDAHHMRTMLFTETARQEDSFFLDALKNLYQRGLDLDWSGVFGGNFYPERLPPQVFERKRHWLKVISPEAFAKFSQGADYDAVLPLPLSDVQEIAAPLSSENAEADKSPDVTAQEGWHYTTTWTKVAIPQEDSAFASRALRWMIVGEDNDLTQAICQKISDRGDGCFWIEQGASSERARVPYPKLDAHIKLDDARQSESWHNAIWDIAHRWSTQEPIPWKVVFVTNDRALSSGSLDALNSYQSDSFTHLIHFLRQLKEQAFFCPVWLVTHNTQQVETEPPSSDLSPLGAPIWGFGKTLFMEQPELRGGMIDIDGRDDKTDCALMILSKAIMPEFEPFVALRSNQIYVQQLKPCTTEPTEMTPLRNDGAFIVTGGLGGLGLSTARWLVEKGARHLVLLSRRSLPAKADWAELSETDAWYDTTRTLIELETAGTKIEISATDVRDAQAIQALFDSLDAQEIPIRGVLHAAGENWFDLVEDLDIDALLQTLKTKVQASWQFHSLTKDRDLDLFVLFSTVSSLWGSSKLSHYTAANHFLDALADHREDLGLPVTNVNWGPWDDVGMSAQDSEKPTLQRLGFYLMPVENALGALEAAIAKNRANSMICAIDWPAYAPVMKFATQPSFFALVKRGDEPKFLAASKRLRALAALEPDVALDTIGRVIRKELQAVTLLDDTDELKGDMRFNIMGMDSLMTLTFAANLENYFQCEFPTTLAYNYPTIDTLAAFIQDVIRQVIEPSEAAGTNEDAPWLRSLNSVQEDKPALICLPFAGSGASAYEGLAKTFEGQREVIAVQIPGREDLAHIAPWTSPQALAERIADELEQRTGLFSIFGHSMGAILAYELVAVLQQRGATLPNVLILSGADRPNVAEHRRAVHQLADEEFVDTVLQAYGSGQVDRDRRIAVDKVKDLLRADLTLLETCETSDVSLSCPVATIYATQDNLVSRQGIAAWVALCDSSFTLTQIDGGHQILFDDPDTGVKAILKAEQLAH